MKPFKKILIKTTILSLVLLVLISITTLASAQELEYTPLAPLPGIGSEEQEITPLLSTYLRTVFKLAIGLAAALAVLMITIGGIQYMSTDAISGKHEGKEKINQALIGLFLAMGSWLILYTINPATLDLKFNPEEIEVITTPTEWTPPVADAFYKYRYCYDGENPHYEEGVEPVATLGVYPYLRGNTTYIARARNICKTTPPIETLEPIPGPNNCGQEGPDEHIICVAESYTPGNP